MKRWIVLLALLWVLVPTAYASEDSPQLDELWEETQEYGVDPTWSLEEGISGLIETGGNLLDELLYSAARSGLRLLVVVLLCGLAEGAGMGRTVGGLSAVTVAGSLAIAALSVGEVSAMIGLGRQTIEQMDSYSEILLPAMAMLTAATGRASTAAVRHGVTILFSQLLLSLIEGLLIPLVYAYVAACCGYAAVGNEGLKKIAELIRWAVRGMLTLLMLSFVAYLSVSGAIAGTADAAVVKAARMAMNRAIPVVGGILSDAAETMLVGAGVLRGTVGVIGLMVVLFICLAPFLQLGAHYLTFKVSAALAGTVAAPRLSGLIENISTAFGLVMGMTGACALLLMVSIISTISAVLI